MTGPAPAVVAQAPITVALPRIGVDLVPLSRISQLREPPSAPALHRMLTPAELRLSDEAGAAGRLAAKEAVFKLFGTPGGPVPWLSTEILPGPGGRPTLRLTGRAARLAREAGLGPVDLSISHDGGWAVAVAVAVITSPTPPTALISSTQEATESRSNRTKGIAMSSAVDTTGIDKVRDWILGRHPDRSELAYDVNIIENRLVDSLAFVELVYAIEDASGQEIDFDTIDVEDFQSLATIQRAFFS
ncbi:4'-phosphopantetheinyl transferase superfamily protein [Streptomyces sp. NPDC059906]|uniref:4'-phosphopantetheinyl transferase superfamily protein n=1 Tax=Streptomyces sp. NPDC059906 TaxID=3346997 RepID=UPI00365CC39B